MVVVPLFFLWGRIRKAKRDDDVRHLTIGASEDHRYHLLAYLFAILLPFYRQDINSWRDLSAFIAALVFIVFLFWHLNLHYMNLIFALLGYRIFNVHPLEDANPHSGKASWILISRRATFACGRPNLRLSRERHRLFGKGALMPTLDFDLEGVIVTEFGVGEEARRLLDLHRFISGHAGERCTSRKCTCHMARDAEGRGRVARV